MTEAAIKIGKDMLGSMPVEKIHTTGFIDAILPKSIPLIQGIGALEFIEELENLEYSEEIKGFYKGSRELVKKLNIL